MTEAAQAAAAAVELDIKTKSGSEVQEEKNEDTPVETKTKTDTPKKRRRPSSNVLKRTAAKSKVAKGSEKGDGESVVSPKKKGYPKEIERYQNQSDYPKETGYTHEGKEAANFSCYLSPWIPKQNEGPKVSGQGWAGTVVMDV